MPTLLLVENEPALLEGLRYAIEVAGYTVLSANSSESAIRICEKHAGRIDILVCDVQMGGLTGFEVAAIAKSIHPNLIVILMSGSPRNTSKQRIVANEFLEKPFTNRELLSAIFRHAPFPASTGVTSETSN